MKVAILSDHNPEMSRKWELACEKKQIEYKTINLLRNDWYNMLREFHPDFCVSRPPGDIQLNKKNFDEKIFFLENYSDYSIYPGFLATYIYENKSALNCFLEANKIQHPRTFVSSDKQEALNYIENAELPIVAKTMIGAAGSGVKIFHAKRHVQEYIDKAFKTGLTRRYGPNRKTGTPKSWIRKALASPDYFFRKLREYKERSQDVQKNLVLFQEYIPHEFEWRIAKIGESYFAYKKLKIGEMSSGSKQFEYGPPPFALLDFTKELCDRFNFCYMAVDIFYTNGQIYVNEMQTIFGHKNPYICKVNDKAGRYIFQNGEWLFEPGDFNTNESYDLRLETAIKLYERSRN